MYNESLNLAERPRVGIIGGGVAGSTIAMQLSQRADLEVILLEQGSSLVNGPPICHLHAGGNLYREIDEQQCVQLLQESVDTLKLFPHCANVRPTVIAVPQRDPGSADELLPRLVMLQQCYQQLVDQDPANQVLGKPADYFRLYSEATMRQLAQLPLPTAPSSPDEWMIPLAKQLDFDTVKWPLVLVQEYGLSLFRLAASAELMLANRHNCQVLLNAAVQQVKPCGRGWRISLENHSVQVDYLINACGYRSGVLDDQLDVASPRLVEFKAAYVTQWSQPGIWPEVIFHGERGTPNGMAQLTPYADGLFQLHGMTDDITLFKDGLAASTQDSAQPLLPLPLRQKLNKGWPAEVVHRRTRNAVAHLAYFLPQFASAQGTAKPLYGAQQIPGDDVTLRAANVAFAKGNYARAEIVKASSAIPAAREIELQLQRCGLLAHDSEEASPAEASVPYQQVLQRAEAIASERNYPVALARRVEPK
ncbi:FAD-dependent oxidoreductase [uncultured Ferrimonas sp.]|uniref:FAD-dependent oxidoreductase n=1 Tax=uncultured Ferrimonas sp. TaxID=432640 RepID=UPI0026037F41|nr:FAD-dependent oxidoreductase [uncultured Ferrimonas sp.]